MTVAIEDIPVKVGNYKGVKLSLLSIDVPEETVQARVKELLEQVVEPVAVSSGVHRDDMVDLSYEGSFGGSSPAYLKQSHVSLKIGSNTFIPGFEEKLIGHKAGEPFTFKINFPAHHINEDLQGRLVTFEVTLHEILRMPEDLFADDVIQRYSEFPNVGELTEAVRIQMEAESDDEVKRYLRTAIEAELAAITEIEIPQALIDTQRDEALEGYRQEVGCGDDLEGYLANTGTTLEQLTENMERQIRTGIAASRALDVIAEQESLTVGDEELAAEAAELAQVSGMDNKQTEEALADEAVVEAMRRHLLHQKALDVVLSNAVIEAGDQ